MLFPIADENTDRTTTPVVNYVLILANVLVFVFLQGLGSNEKFTYAFSTVPAEIITGRDITTRPVVVQNFTGQRMEMPGLQPTPIPVYLTLLTSMFMHGGIAHIFGNMLFLWIFGDNIEDRLGHIRYLIFYLICGIIAGLSHVLATAAFASGEASRLVPSLGASGAISGVLGAYLLLFPTNRVVVLLGWFATPLPAFIAIGLWFVFQLINGLGVLGAGSQAGGGVAYAAHIGGFVAGLLLIKVFEIGRRPPDRYYEREF
jgi:membrane associated rhomboid family serine protease